jgi:hypothetical protein
VSDWVDRIVAEAMGRAEQVWDEEAELGRLVWALADGQRCYVDGDTLTWVFPDGRRLVLEYPGIDLATVL